MEQLLYVITAVALLLHPLFLPGQNYGRAGQQIDLPTQDELSFLARHSPRIGFGMLLGLMLSQLPGDITVLLFVVTACIYAQKRWGLNPNTSDEFELKRTLHPFLKVRGAVEVCIVAFASISVLHT